jgi:radical SAM protein with 4Fe4S-binding SPASM domain
MKKIVKKVSGKFSEMYILGGEPTLHPELQEVLKLGLDNFRIVILVTNGLRLADKEYCKRIALPRLSISMHRRAISQKARRLVNKLSQNEKYFSLSNRAWTNVEDFWQGDVNVQLNLLKPLIKDGHAMDVFKWARSKVYEPIMELTKPGPIFERGHRLDVPSEEIRKLFEEMQDYDKKHYPQLMADVLVPPSYGHSCTMVETGIHVYVDGTIVPCVAHTGISLGNILSDEINMDEIINSPIRQAIKNYQDWIVGPCRKCEHFEYCHGGCRGEAFWDTGCPRASDPYCWHVPKKMTLKEIVPISCEGCLLEKHPGCGIKF